MKHKRNNIFRLLVDCIVAISKALRLHLIFLLIVGLSSCSDFVEVGQPKNLLVSETVFNDPATVESALANIFYKLRDQGMVSGRFGLTTLMGIYSDELDYYGFDANSAQFYNHNVVSANPTILGWWSNAYNLVYAANDIIAGVGKSNVLSAEEKGRFKGQALFVRAYIHSILASLFGDVPYVDTTDYLTNNSVSRLPVDTVFERIISDLEVSIDLLEGTQANGERVEPNQSAAKALLARMYLYTENWEMAELVSGELIAIHALEPNVNDVFLKGSSETLWQLKPGVSPINTHEANQLIIQAIPGQQYALTESLLNAFEPDDLRFSNWIGTKSNADNSITLHFAYKYKATFAETQPLEYSIIFRLSEQYLIRAEARANLGDISGSQDDLNTIRNRAGLENTSEATASGLLDAIARERRVELFAEQGQRWFDLKRTNKAEEVLASVKPNWQITDVLLPIPESEIELNPNLLPQNEGY